MRPEPIEFSHKEGWEWEPFKKLTIGGQRNPGEVHAIKFSDGSVFDTVNGWRGPAGSDWSFPKPRYRVRMGRAVA